MINTTKQITTHCSTNQTKPPPTNKFIFPFNCVLTILQLASNQQDIFGILLQEPWTTSSGTPLVCPGFDIFYTAVPAKCCTYIRKAADLKPSFIFTSEQSFLAINISLQESPITLYNFYSLGRPTGVADLLTTLKPDWNAIVHGDFKAHHEQCYGQLASSFPERMLNEQRDMETICNWFATHSFTLENTLGVTTNLPFYGHPPSVIDLCCTADSMTTLHPHWRMRNMFGSDHAATILSFTSSRHANKHFST